MRSIRAYIIVALHMAAIMTGCNAQGPEESTETSAPSTTGSPFATAQSIVTEINRLADAGTIRCRDLATMVYAETPFQREWVTFLELVARAEDLHDAAADRFGEPIDAERGDLRINLSFQNAFLVTEDGRRAEAAVESAADNLRKLMLVQVGPRWWISGYTWEHSMSTDQRMELPKRSLSFRVEAEIGPALAARIRSGEFATIADLRAAHRKALMTYFESHPDVYEQITGKPFRRP